MRLLTVPNWSFGRDRDLLRLFEDLLTGWDLTIHFLQGDVDHNRTVTAFSGRPDVVFERLERLAEAAFERIDLNRHVGIHPRIGALDVCPFLPLTRDAYPLRDEIEAFCTRLSDRHGLPIFLYELSERGRHAGDLPTLRSGGFGGLLLEEAIPSDFGPSQAHPRLGVSVVGERRPLIAVNVNFHGDDLRFVRSVAEEIRELRREGRPRFTGVRALGMIPASRALVQVGLVLTEPDFTSPDSVIEHVLDRARRTGIPHAGNELIGVIRACDLAGATRLPIQASQVIEGVN